MKSGIVYTAALAFVALASPATGWAHPNCPEGHCWSVSDAMNQFCVAMGLAGKPFLVVGPSGGHCFCPCSCVAAETRVLMSDRKSRHIPEIQLGDEVLSPFSESSNRVARTLSTPVDGYPALVITFFEDRTITVSRNHTFVRPNLRTVTAESLSPGDFVATYEGQHAEVISVAARVPYSGAMQNLIINETSAAGLDHLVITNGLLSGDFVVQTRSDAVARDIDLRSERVQIHNLHSPSR